MHDRKSLQHTLDHIDCHACEGERLALNRKTEMRHLKFKDAAELVLEEEREHLAEENAGVMVETDSLRVGARTYSDHVDFVRRLNRFFAALPLEKIHEGHWRSYQKLRAEGGDGEAGAGPSLINHEIAFLKRTLKRAGLWTAISQKCPSLQVPKSTVARAMTPEEESVILFTAASRPRWKPFYLASLLMLNTTRPHGEIRFLRIRDLDMQLRILSFREGRGVFKAQPEGGFRRAMKTGAREQDLPMTDTVYGVCGELLKRYRRICRRLHIETSEDHYLFPGRARGKQLDPTRPVKSWKKAWGAICDTAGVANLRLEDFRHHASTKLQEDHMVAPGVVEQIMGHEPGSKTKKDYRHIRHQAALQALQRIEVKPVHSVQIAENVVEMPRPQAVGSGGKK